MASAPNLLPDPYPIVTSVETPSKPHVTNYEFNGV